MAALRLKNLRDLPARHRGALKTIVGAVRRPKYGNKKIKADGYTFDSIAEFKHYEKLRLLEKAHVIADLKIKPRFHIEIGGKPVLLRSPRYPNGRVLTYEADFSYVNTNTQVRVVEDVKGKDTRVSAIKRALVEAIYDIRVEVVKL